jgi:hypothetical protein
MLLKSFESNSTSNFRQTRLTDSEFDFISDFGFRLSDFCRTRNIKEAKIFLGEFPSLARAAGWKDVFA